MPDPPVELPRGCLVHVPGVGELFVRDTGGDGPPVLLLHGWMFPSDLNWYRAYEPLSEAGYRVLAMDHRGHGRGLRTTEQFSLAACAADAAALVRTLDLGPVTAVGYSMGGPIASLMARDHADMVSGLVLGATAPDWTEPRMKLLWRSMGVLRIGLNVFPLSSWRWGLRRAGFPDSPTTSWVAAELSRGSGRDLAEAGRELGRFDSRPWIQRLQMPAAVIVTTSDTAVPPRKQRELAEALGAPVFEIDCDHAGVTVKGAEFARVLLEALRAVAPVTLHSQR
jgi:pimeloyl-ACP methyl ester carboxylesterase